MFAVTNLVRVERLELSVYWLEAKCVATTPYTHTIWLFGSLLRDHQRDPLRLEFFMFAVTRCLLIFSIHKYFMNLFLLFS
jgi:hypothetical protein